MSANEQIDDGMNLRAIIWLQLRDEFGRIDEFGTRACHWRVEGVFGMLGALSITQYLNEIPSQSKSCNELAALPFLFDIVTASKVNALSGIHNHAEHMYMKPTNT